MCTSSIRHGIGDQVIQVHLMRRMCITSQSCLQEKRYVRRLRIRRPVLREMLDCAMHNRRESVADKPYHALALPRVRTCTPIVIPIGPRARFLQNAASQSVRFKYRDPTFVNLYCCPGEAATACPCISRDASWSGQVQAGTHGRQAWVVKTPPYDGLPC